MYEQLHFIHIKLLRYDKKAHIFLYDKDFIINLEIPYEIAKQGRINPIVVLLKLEWRISYNSYFTLDKPFYVIK